MPETTYSERAPVEGLPHADGGGAAPAALIVPGEPDASGRGGPLRGSLADDPLVRAAVAAAYEIAGHAGPAELRAHDLLRRLHRSARVLDAATATVKSETVGHPDSAVAGEALLLLEKARQIGLFY